MIIKLDDAVKLNNKTVVELVEAHNKNFDLIEELEERVTRLECQVSTLIMIGSNY